MLYTLFYFIGISYEVKNALFYMRVMVVFRTWQARNSETIRLRESGMTVLYIWQEIGKVAYKGGI